MPAPLNTSGLPGFENTVPLDVDQGPPAPIIWDPFGPNPWAGGGQSPTNTPSTGTVRNFGASPTVWGTVLLLAILLL
jgi:hypothetical protein